MALEKVAIRSLIVPVCTRADFVSDVQNELNFVLNNYGAVKKNARLSAQSNLMSQQEVAANQIKADLKILDKSARTFAKGKASGTKQAYFNERAPKIRHDIADPVVQGFEVAYKQSRTDKAAVLKRIANMTKFIGCEGWVNCITNHGNQDNWLIVVWNGVAWINVIELWFDAARFMETQTTGVFVHRTKPDRQYVRDRHGFFIARYLIRNLSEYDRKMIETDPTPDPVLTARSNRIPTEASLIDDITTHVRAKEASGGQTCFLSFSHTKHTIVGSTAALFYRQEKGDIIIDASKVPQAARVDLHSLGAVREIFGVTDVNPTMAFAEGDDAYERNAAARDTVRTREILVAGSVPKAAVVAVRLSTKAVKAPWTTLEGAPAQLPAGIPDAWRT